MEHVEAAMEQEHGTGTCGIVLLYLLRSLHFCGETKELFFPVCRGFAEAADLAVTDDLFHAAILQVFPFIFSERVLCPVTAIQAATFFLTS